MLNIPTDITPENGKEVLLQQNRELTINNKNIEHRTTFCSVPYSTGVNQGLTTFHSWCSFWQRDTFNKNSSFGLFRNLSFLGICVSMWWDRHNSTADEPAQQTDQVLTSLLIGNALDRKLHSYIVH